MGLHQKLTANLAVVVNHEVVHSRFVELFTDSQTCGAGADNCYCSLEDFCLTAGPRLRNLFSRKVGLVNSLNAFNLIYFGNADTPYLAVYEHFACPALSNPAFHCALPVLQTVLVNHFPCLVQCSCYSETLLTGNLFPLKKKFYSILRRDGQDRMFGNFVHS